MERRWRRTGEGEGGRYHHQLLTLTSQFCIIIQKIVVSIDRWSFYASSPSSIVHTLEQWGNSEGPIKSSIDIISEPHA